MADPNSPTTKLAYSSKENPWYHQSLKDQISPPSRQLLEEYSQIPENEVDDHIYKLRDILWGHAPYPCIGEFKFINLNLPKHPSYSKILSILQPSSTSPAPKLLDVGCCIGQELRGLSHFGKIPSENLYGTDIIGSYLETSYELFNDREKFKSTLVPADVFSHTLFNQPSGEFAGWDGLFTIIHAGLFLHLFDCERQLVVCQILVRLLNKRPGSLFVGEMVGCDGSGIRGPSGTEKFWKKSAERKRFLHDEGSFADMWKEVEKRTRTQGLWKVESKLRLRDKGDRESKGRYFVGEGIGWLTFCVEFIGKYDDTLKVCPSA